MYKTNSSIVPSNNMTKLLNKIERRNGTRILNLPAQYSKDNWAKVIEEDTLDTFSRLFPYTLPYNIDVKNDKCQDGMYKIDLFRYGGDVEIIGIIDIDWSMLGRTSGMMNQGYHGISGYPSLGYYNPDDILMGQMTLDLASMVDNDIYIKVFPPDKIRITNAMNISVLGLNPIIPINVMVKHAKNLSTIEPTKFETLEKLAAYDVKIFLYEELKHYDKLETIFLNSDLKIDDWSNAQSDRDQFVQELYDKYVSSANQHQPLFFSL